MTHQLLLSLISAIFIAGAAAYVGTLMLSRKMAVVAGPLGHLALPGAAIALIGDISQVGIAGTIAAVVLGTAAHFAILRTCSQIMLINIHEDLAKSEGINIKPNNLVYLLSIAAIVALGVGLVGGLMTAALVAIPAAAARNISKTLFPYGLTSGKLPYLHVETRASLVAG